MFVKLRNLNYLNKFMTLPYMLLALGGVWMLGNTLLANGGLFMVGMLAVFVVALPAGIGLLHWTLGNKVMLGQWRTAQTVLAFLNLTAFPLGTLYGAYALWVVLGSEGKGEFEEAAQMMGEFEPFGA